MSKEELEDTVEQVVRKVLREEKVASDDSLHAVSFIGISQSIKFV